MQTCIKHRTSLYHAEMTLPWPPGSDPEEARGTLTTLLPWDTVQGLSERPGQERFGTHVMSKWGRSRSLSTIYMSHPREVWSWKDLQSVYTSMCSFHCGLFFKSVKCIDRSLLPVLQSNCVEICWSQFQQCAGLAEHTADAVSSCGGQKHSEWGPCVGHMRPRSQHSGVPTARPRRSPDKHHPKGHEGVCTPQPEKDSEEWVLRGK
jgi:hypothetical protein